MESITEYTAETLAHALLNLTADYPGMNGRLRSSRIISGRTVSTYNGQENSVYKKYEVAADWPMTEVVALVDAMINGGLVALTGARPTLVLTRAGFRALEALDAGMVDHS